MTRYSFRCAEHGPAHHDFPIGSAPDRAPCPRCGSLARRVFDSPALATLGSARRTALDLAARSAERPDVTTSIPAAASSRRPPAPRGGPEPRRTRLPRP